MRVNERRAVVARAGGCCEYCRTPRDFATQSFAIEHILPRHHGGPDTLANTALACDGCNEHKSTKIEAPDPHDGTLVPLFHPRRQRWMDHFEWADTFTRVVGRTPTGRATIEALYLNRPGLVNLRALLWAAGEHPRSIPADSVMPDA
jgi:hypothetical protein